VIACCSWFRSAGLPVVGAGPVSFAAITSALAFDYFCSSRRFILCGGTAGRLAGSGNSSWAVAILWWAASKAALTKAQTSEHEAILMYELSAALASLRTQEAVAHTVARFFYQRYLANVTVLIQPGTVNELPNMSRRMESCRKT